MILEKQGSGSLSSPFGDLFVEVAIQIGLLQDLSYDICGPSGCLGAASGKLGVLDALLSERELEHLDSLDEVAIYVFLRAQLGLELMYALLHLRLFKEPLGLPRVDLALVLLQKVNNVGEGYLRIASLVYLMLLLLL